MVSTDAKQAIVQYAQVLAKFAFSIGYGINTAAVLGRPIPVIHCPSCGTLPVLEEDLPIRLPDNVTFTGRGPSPLAQLDNWVNVPCPTHASQGRRTRWIRLLIRPGISCAILMPKTSSRFSTAKTNDWMPVDQYVGGIEHAILHLLYSFFTKVCAIAAYEFR